MPYSTCLVAASLVVQVMVAVVCVMLETVILEITGGVMSAAACVVADTGEEKAERLPAASTARTRQRYEVEAVRILS